MLRHQSVPAHGETALGKPTRPPATHEVRQPKCPVLGHFGPKSKTRLDNFKKKRFTRGVGLTLRIGLKCSSQLTFDQQLGTSLHFNEHALGHALVFDGYHNGTLLDCCHWMAACVTT